MGAHRIALHAALICGFIPLVRGQVLQLPAWLCVCFARILCQVKPFGLRLHSCWQSAVQTYCMANCSKPANNRL